MTGEFKAFPKITRTDHPVVVTEKIDGTNACIHIIGDGEGTFSYHAQSRNKIITPGKQSDNAGFAAWVDENIEELALLLGDGYHYGEWWGKGINRGYDQEGKNFSLFNAGRWGSLDLTFGGVRVRSVPVLSTAYPWDSALQDEMDALLLNEGSAAAPGFMRPEGYCVWFRNGMYLKRVLDK